MHVGVRSFSPHTSAWLVLRGWARASTADGPAEARAGEWLISPPGERLQEASDDCRHLSIAFVARWVFGRELFPFVRPFSFPETEVPALRVHGLRLAAEAARHFPKARHDLPDSSGPLFAHVRLAAGFYAWFESVETVMKNRRIEPVLMEVDPRVEEAVRVVNRTPSRTPLPRELASHAGLGLSQFNRLFRQELGMSIHAYCQQRKLGAARALLAAPGSRVKETAFHLGFLSSQHFSRWFHMRTGMTPSQYQDRAGMAL